MRSSHTSARSHAQADSGDFPTFNWLRSVAADHAITTARRLILVRLCLFRNGNNGICNPSYDAIAEALKVDRATIIRAVADGVRRGWLAPPTRRGPASNLFDFTFQQKKSHQCDINEPEDVAPVQPLSENDVAPVHKRCRTSAQKMSHPCDPNGISNGIREREYISHAPDDASPVKKKAAAGEREGAGAERHLDAESAETSFAEFWRAYPRKVAKEAARKTFAKAVEGGVSVATLIAGAQRYAAERSGEDPKYTKHATTWLNAGCWDDEASGAPVIDQDGNVVAVERPPPQRQRGHDPSAARWALAEQLERELCGEDEGDEEQEVSHGHLR